MGTSLTGGLKYWKIDQVIFEYITQYARYSINLTGRQKWLDKREYLERQSQSIQLQNERVRHGRLETAEEVMAGQEKERIEKLEMK
jgi:hypothetical protein